MTTVHAAPPGLPDRLAAAADAEAKVARALDAIGALAGRDVLLVDGAGLRIAADLAALGGRVAHATAAALRAGSLPVGSTDAVVGLWSSFRGLDAAEVAAAERVLRPGGRVFAVHHYGRDDVTRLLPDRAVFEAWGRREGPFLTAGFRLRVVHAFLTFDDLEAAAAALTEGFGEPGAALAATMHRPRLAWNVAIYHRERGPETAR